MRNHRGEIIPEETLQAALKKVAADVRDSARIARTEKYASHITEDQKDEFMQKKLDLADEIEAGTARGFWLWQRVNTIVTGECVAFLPN
jgi:hypothetical protein